jgi:hypothetical protein
MRNRFRAVTLALDRMEIAARLVGLDNEGRADASGLVIRWNR